MSRMLVVAALAILAALAGIAAAWKFGFTRGAVPHDAPPIIAELHAHLVADGIDSDVYRVKNMSSNAQARTLFTLRRPGKPSFFVYVCADVAAAARHLDDLRRLSAQTRPETNGVLLMNVSENPDDPVFETVRRSFRSFRVGAPSRPATAR